jgi:5-bromo-4-chloroindolyl phosphate hydrolysis protein
MQHFEAIRPGSAFIMKVIFFSILFDLINNQIFMVEKKIEIVGKLLKGNQSSANICFKDVIKCIFYQSSDHGFVE